MVLFEEEGMGVPLPVLADVRVDDCRAIGQQNVCNALPRLTVPLNVVPLRCNSNLRTPSCDHLHPQDILCFEGLGVHEGGVMLLILALRLPVLNLPVLTASPSGRWKSPKTSAQHREERFASAHRENSKVDAQSVSLTFLTMSAASLDVPSVTTGIRTRLSPRAVPGMDLMPGIHAQYLLTVHKTNSPHLADQYWPRNLWILVGVSLFSRH